MSSFFSLHPAVLFLYYIIVISVSMFFLNPLILVLSVTGSFFFSAFILSRKTLLKSAAAYLALFIVISLSNPLFSHNGVTVLFFLNNNPVTLESVYYGMGISLMLISVFNWFRNYTGTLTTDKFLFLFSRISPRIALVISMVFRFIPMFKKQISDVSTARKSLGIKESEGVLDKIRNTAAVFSIMVTWALETGIETAGSMKARGYGTGKRSNFSVFSFGKKDFISLLFILILGLTVYYGASGDALYFSYYPAVSGIKAGPLSLISYSAFLILVLMPGLIQIKEIIKWKYFLSAT